MHSRILLIVACIALFSVAHSQTYTQPPVRNYWGSCYNFLPSSYANTNVPAHLQWTRYLNDNINYNLTQTLYKNNNWTVWWGDNSCDPSFYSVTDCSGLITATLARAYNYSLSNRSWAYTYAEATMYGTKGWQNISFLNTKVGDLFSIDYYYVPGVTTAGNTGHNGWVNSLPYVFNPQQAPFVPDTTQYALPLLDQTSTPHGSNDSRYAINAKGLGEGNIRIYVSNTNGSIMGYTWSINTTTYYNQSYNSVWIGRLMSNYTITPKYITTTTVTVSGACSQTGILNLIGNFTAATIKCNDTATQAQLTIKQASPTSLSTSTVSATITSVLSTYSLSALSITVSQVAESTTTNSTTSTSTSSSSSTTTSNTNAVFPVAFVVFISALVALFAF